MLSEALRLIRVFHDLKQTELADRLGLSKSYLSEIESGRKTPAVEVIEKYASVFNIPTSSIFFFSESLGGNKGHSHTADKTREAIAGKVLDFLRFIERRTNNNDKEEYKIPH